MTLVVGFIDDSRSELKAFKAVFGKDFKLVLAQTTGKFIDRLQKKGQIDLLLFDLYFPLKDRKPRKPLKPKKLRKILAPVASFRKTLMSQSSPDQLGIAEELRRSARTVLTRLLDDYPQGPEGGLAAMAASRSLPILTLFRHLKTEG